MASNPDSSGFHVDADTWGDEFEQSLQKTILGLVAAGNKDDVVDETLPANQTHDKVAERVYRRLLQRHAQIRIIMRLTNAHVSEGADLNASVPPSTGAAHATPPSQPGSEADNPQQAQPLGMDDRASPELRAYRLAVTDIFVEKALTYLEDRAVNYKASGNFYFKLGFGMIGFGIAIAGAIVFLNLIPSRTPHPDDWASVLSRFITSFTLYGLIVTLAVYFWRFGRAKLDQAERLLERRHALRQGRLFVHLHDGRISMDDMEKIFHWNDSQPNAFSSIATDTKAPWGSILTETIKAVPKTADAGARGAGKVGKKLGKRTEKSEGEEE